MDINQTQLWTAVITPLHENQRVDYKSLEKVLKQQEEAQNGILILGSTGEALNLTLVERKSILEFTLELNLKSPIMCGVGGSDLFDTLSWLNYLETLKIDSYLMVTPLYSKPGRLGQYYWFKALMDRATKPCVLYNVPSRTGISLNFETLTMLRDHRNLWGIKEASGSIEDFSNYKSLAPNAKLFSGDDALLPEFSALGAEGLISVASNVWPKATHQYVKKCLSGELTDQEKTLWQESSNSLFLASNPVPAKRIMAHNKSIETAVTKAPLHHLDLDTLSPIIENDKKIQSWYSTNS